MLRVLLLALLSTNALAMEDDVVCLATNIYFEARNQSNAGQLAVGLVTLNRVADKRYPNSICKVVTQAKTYNNGFPIRNKCQFSWYCDGLSDRIRDQAAYNHAMEMAQSAILAHQFGIDFTDGATHYHAENVKPFWSEHLTYIFTVDEHHFYRREK